jgi:hypothetical protein
MEAEPVAVRLCQGMQPTHFAPWGEFDIDLNLPAPVLDSGAEAVDIKL